LLLLFNFFLGSVSFFFPFLDFCFPPPLLSSCRHRLWFFCRFFRFQPRGPFSIDVLEFSFSVVGGFVFFFLFLFVLFFFWSVHSSLFLFCQQLLGKFAFFCWCVVLFFPNGAWCPQFLGSFLPPPRVSFFPFLFSEICSFPSLSFVGIGFLYILSLWSPQLFLVNKKDFYPSPEFGTWLTDSSFSSSFFSHLLPLRPLVFFWPFAPFSRFLPCPQKHNHKNLKLFGGNMVCGGFFPGASTFFRERFSSLTVQFCSSLLFLLRTLFLLGLRYFTVFFFQRFRVLLHSLLFVVVSGAVFFCVLICLFFCWGCNGGVPFSSGPPVLFQLGPEKTIFR